jgi:hypothetical protein
MVMGFRLRRTLKTYDIEASVNSRLLSGIIDVNVPMYQLTIPPRDRPEYWSYRPSDGSRHGASWQNINWQREEIDEKTIQVHFSDRIKFPEASIRFADLIRYLGDLGLQTNPKGFWKLSQQELNVVPGTPLVGEIGEDGVETPILVTAKRSVEHPGTLLLRFENKPSKTLRTANDLGPEWIRVPTITASTDIVESRSVNGIEAEKQLRMAQVSETTEKPQDTANRADMKMNPPELVEYLHISPRGIVKKKLKGGETRPVEGLPYWFVYSILASIPEDQHQKYNGRPSEYQIQLDRLYFSREATFRIVGMDGPLEFGQWTSFMLGLVNDAKINAIPEEWTKDSPARTDDDLDKRFADLRRHHRSRNRAKMLRQSRQESFQIIRSDVSQHLFGQTPVHVPFEVLSISPFIWFETAGHCTNYIYPLTPDRVPTSQEICVAAVSNPIFARRVGDTLTKFEKCFDIGDDENDEGYLKYILDLPGLNFDVEQKVTVMCAIIILQSIADGSAYLAAQMDVASCIKKWDPVYLC